MKFTKSLRTLIAAGVLLPLSAQAQDSTDGWEKRFTIYGWLTDIAGQTQFLPNGGGPSIEVGIDDILDNLDFTMMGSLQLNKGSWGLFNDLIYLDVGASKNRSRDFVLGPNEQIPGNVRMDAKLDLKSWLWTVAGTYSLARSDHNSVDLLFGARMVDMSQKLSWTFSGDIADTPIPGRSGDAKVSATNWDAVIGIKGFRHLGENGKWILPWYADIGTGDSDFTWHAMAGIGYSFSWGEAVLSYRYLDYEMDSDSPIRDMNFSGPMIGASFAW